MAIMFTDDQIETDLTRLAEIQPGSSSKTVMAKAVLRRATRMSTDQLDAWLREPEIQPAAAAPGSGDDTDD